MELKNIQKNLTNIVIIIGLVSSLITIVLVLMIMHKLLQKTKLT